MPAQRLFAAGDLLGYRNLAYAAYGGKGAGHHLRPKKFCTASLPKSAEIRGDQAAKTRNTAQPYHAKKSGSIGGCPPIPRDHDAGHQSVVAACTTRKGIGGFKPARPSIATALRYKSKRRSQ